MTERTSETDRATMREVDHTHPHTDAPFGESGVYDRGHEDAPETVTPDGGPSERDEADDGEPVRTDGGADVPSQPGWAVHGVADGDR